MGEVLPFSSKRARLITQAYSTGFTAGEEHGYTEGFKDALKLIEQRAESLAEVPAAAQELYATLIEASDGALPNLIQDLLRR